MDTKSAADEIGKMSDNVLNGKHPNKILNFTVVHLPAPALLLLSHPHPLLTHQSAKYLFLNHNHNLYVFFSI
jgi:hypothetical protein